MDLTHFVRERSIAHGARVYLSLHGKSASDQYMLANGA